MSTPSQTHSYRSLVPLPDEYSAKWVSLMKLKLGVDEGDFVRFFKNDFGLQSLTDVKPPYQDFLQGIEQAIKAKKYPIVALLWHWDLFIKGRNKNPNVTIDDVAGLVDTLANLAVEVPGCYDYVCRILGMYNLRTQGILDDEITHVEASLKSRSTAKQAKKVAKQRLPQVQKWAADCPSVQLWDVVKFRREVCAGITRKLPSSFTPSSTPPSLWHKEWNPKSASGGTSGSSDTRPSSSASSTRAPPPSVASSRASVTTVQSKGKSAETLSIESSSSKQTEPARASSSRALSLASTAPSSSRRSSTSQQIPASRDRPSGGSTRSAQPSAQRPASVTSSLPSYRTIDPKTQNQPAPSSARPSSSSGSQAADDSSSSDLPSLREVRLLLLPKTESERFVLGVSMGWALGGLPQAHRQYWCEDFILCNRGNYELFNVGICQMLGALFEMQEARVGTMWGDVLLTIPIDASAVKWETLKLLGTIYHWGNMSVGLNALELEKSIVRLYAHLRAHQRFLPGECLNYLGALATPRLGTDLVSRSLDSAERSSGLGPSADQVAAWSQTSPPVTVAGAAWWSDLNETLSRMSLS